ncbi:MAG: 3-methyl-2-oxobutanoate dehydrogenase subunit beta [Desulfobacterales bacterium]|nr:3-methyl-2-oxobutanoate dehydrogenase subunit beta [Desulfobacterales bacterium]
MSSKRILSTGNDAIGHGAIAAGCRFFCGYPITPQNEIPAFFAKELPKVDGTFVQTESEISSINMLMGYVATGKRGITTTSSPGYSLMQEGISAIHAMQLPAVVVNVQRGGPGSGSIATAQTDYHFVTKSAGHGGMKSIVLAPASVQECHDFVQLAFHLSDKYRILAIVLSDAIVGQSAEMIEVKTIDYEEELPAKTWGLKGSSEKGGMRMIHDSFMPFTYMSYFPMIKPKTNKIEAEEIRFEQRYMDDAEFLVISWGSTARIALEAINKARADGMKVGLFRPISLYPFPKEAMIEAAKNVKKVLVVEDNQGQMLYDVEWALQGKVPISFLGIDKRDQPGGMGLLYPKPILEEIRRFKS